MLDIIRTRAKGWLLWGIIILISIPFALFGVNQYVGGGGPAVVAKVNGTEITEQRLQVAYLQQRERLRQMLGGNFDPEMFPEDTMRRQVLDSLIERELLLQAAAGARMGVGDEQLAAAIRSEPAFHENGAFSPALYEQLLRQQRMSPGGFEARMRRDMLLQFVSQGVRDTAFVTPNESTAFARLQGQTRDIGYMVVPSEPFLDEVEVSSDEVEQFYNENEAMFAVPEAVKVAYVELSKQQLADDIEVDEATLRQRYEAQLVNFRTPPEVQARHILFQVSEDADESAVAEAREQAQSVLDELRQGAEFAELAKEYSDDPGSAQQGGDLGFFGRNVMTEPFTEAAFALEAGELSELVRTEFGFHIIRVEERRGGETQPFEAVRDTILQEVRNERAEERFYEAAEQLANLTYEHPDTLEIAAEALDLTIETSDFFPQGGGEGVLSDPKVARAAFSEEVKTEGLNSETVELGVNHLLVLRVVERRPASTRPLDEVREDIVTQLKQRKALELATERAQDLVAELRDGADPQTLAERHQLQWQRQEGLKRRPQAEIDRAVAQAAFSLPKPGAGEAVYEQVPSTNRDPAVLAVLAVHEGEVSEATEAPQGLASGEGEAALDALIQRLREQAEITVKLDG